MFCCRLLLLLSVVSVIRYSSCRYNERQLIHVTVVNVCVHGRNVGVIARDTAGGREPVEFFCAIDLVVHLLLNGTSLVTRGGAEDAHVRVPYPRALCKLYKPNLFLQPSVHRRRVPRLPILSKLMGFTMRSTSLLALLRQTKVSPVQASLGSKSDVRVHGRNITYVRIDFCRLIPGTYVRIWDITYV